MKKTGVIVVIILGILVLSLIAYLNLYKASPSNPQTSDNRAASGKTITIDNFAYSPSNLNINIGDTVVWTNNDRAAHTVTSDSGSELNSQTLSTGQTYSHTFNAADTYNYYCSFHPNMKAKVIVS